jgi:excisionase family DNA binding protein
MSGPPLLPHLPPVLTVAEVAREIRRSSMNVYQLIRDGSLRAVRTTTSRRKKSRRESYVVLADDLRSFIAGRRT